MSATITAHGQTSAPINTAINNTLTRTHINIPFTRLYIIPPENFIISKSLNGLDKGNTATIKVVDNLEGNYYWEAERFTKLKIEKKGISVIDLNKIKVNGYPAKIVSMLEDQTIKHLTILFGDSTFATTITATYSLNDEETEKEIITSLNTISYKKNKEIDPFESAYFSFEESNSKFKFSEFRPNAYMYTINGKKLKNTGDPLIAIYQYPVDKSVTPGSITDGIIRQFKHPGTKYTIKNSSSESISGYDAYTVEVYPQVQGKNNGVLYFCVIIKDEKAIDVKGIANHDIENNLKEFRKLVAAIKMK
ncbi:hypothetical protein FPE01S_03_07590 [Flavihumibacter petaseus NBRC 106054]|uniref:Uncharacterized protein n=2 Tax=Flavihumibacter TaxID=1004301 RepID=A0A0E9N5U9_9BACT|nr:hypothetical protein FPE01S_03_07590 [Flavihumibacter petaseus NBRC 106054]